MIIGGPELQSSAEAVFAFQENPYEKHAVAIETGDFDSDSLPLLNLLLKRQGWAVSLNELHDATGEDVPLTEQSKRVSAFMQTLMKHDLGAHIQWCDQEDETGFILDNGAFLVTIEKTAEHTGEQTVPAPEALQTYTAITDDTEKDIWELEAEAMSKEVDVRLLSEAPSVGMLLPKIPSQRANVLQKSRPYQPIIERADSDDPLAWQQEGLCAQTDPESFFPEKGGSTRDAKKICSGCDVKAECLDYALNNDERFGIWGGLSERERRRIKRTVAT